MKVTIDINTDIPEGFEAVRYGTANPGEYFLYQGSSLKAIINIDDVLILKKKEVYTLEELKPGDKFRFTEEGNVELYPCEYVKLRSSAYFVANSCIFRHGDTVHMTSSLTRVKKIDRD